MVYIGVSSLIVVENPVLWLYIKKIKDFRTLLCGGRQIQEIFFGVGGFLRSAALL